MIQDVRDFVAVVYAPMDIIEVRCLLNGDSRRSWHMAYELPEKAEDFAELNSQGWNIYVGAAPRPRPNVSGDEAIELCRCLFADFDAKHFNGSTDRLQHVRDRIKAAKLPVASMLLDSGHGYHAYWRLQEPLSPDRWKIGNTRLSAVLGSDTSINNPERIMRLPGLMNNKPPAKPCCILEHDAARTYSPADFVALREPEKPEMPIQPPEPVARPMRISGSSLDRALAYAATWEPLFEGQGRNTALYRHIKQLYVGMDFSESIARQAVESWNQRNQPPLSPKELETTIRNALKYDSKETPGCKNTGKIVKPVILKSASGSPSTGVWRDMEDSIAGRRKTIPWLIHEISDLTHCTLPGEVVIVVGQAGSAKSYWLLQEAANWFKQGHKIAILEAEKTVKYHLNRLAAQYSGHPGFVYPEWQQDHPELARGVKTDHEAFMDAFGLRMTDNGQNTLTISSVIEWVRMQAEDGCRLIIIDPLTVVDRETTQTWEADKRFVGSVQTICSNNNCTLIFVLHCTKERVEPALENVGGGAAFTQLADCVLWLYFHKKEDGELKTSYVRTGCGTAPDAIIHDRSVYVLKSRYEGTGSRIVCTFDNLRMESHGIAVAKLKA